MISTGYFLIPWFWVWPCDLLREVRCQQIQNKQKFEMCRHGQACPLVVLPPLWKEYAPSQAIISQKRMGVLWRWPGINLSWELSPAELWLHNLIDLARNNSNISINIENNINDKVLTFYPRCNYHNDSVYPGGVGQARKKAQTSFWQWQQLASLAKCHPSSLSLLPVPSLCHLLETCRSLSYDLVTMGFPWQLHMVSPEEWALPTGKIQLL